MRPPARRLLAGVGGTVLALVVLLAPWTATAAASTSPAPSPVASPSAPPANEPAERFGAAPVLLILDASGSMRADDGTGRPKMEAAREAVTALIDGLSDDAVVGLRAYGHRTPNTDPVAGCADTELLVPVGHGNQDQLRAAVDGLSPSGFTPIGASLRAALEDLPGVEGRTVVLVSDGIDTCAPPAACETARQIVAEGVDLRVEAVGFQVDATAAEELRCIAEATGGGYRPAEDAEELADELQSTVAVGTPVEGAATPAGAPVLGAGQYVDVLGHPSPRWYAVDLEDGERLTATATVRAGADVAELPVSVELQLGATDVLGLTSCDTDQGDVVGVDGPVLTVEGLEVVGGRVCADPGRYAIGLQLTGPDDPDRDVRAALDALEVPVELVLGITAAPAPAEAGASETAAAPVALPAGRSGRPPTPGRLYVGTFLGATLVGGVSGIALSRRLGP